MRGIISALTWVLFIYLAYCTILFFMQRQMLFPRDMIPEPSRLLLDVPNMERVWLETRSGRVEAWFLRPAAQTGAGPVPAVIFGHGNTELIDYWPDEFRRFNAMGMGLLLVEFPGYGRSGGRPSQESVTDAFVAGYDWLVSRGDVDASRILLFGRSLGAAAVCQLAARRPSRAMVLMSAFTGVREFASRYMIPPFLIRDPFDTLAVVREYEKPILVIHGIHDRLIPVSHAQKLAEAGAKARLILYDCERNDCPPDWPRFWNDVRAFLAEAGILPASQSPMIHPPYRGR